MATDTALRLGTRASLLARWQADWVAQRLRACGTPVSIAPISTLGDRRQSGPIGAIGSDGVFTKELQRALLDGQVDLVVHSLKDLPTEPVEGLLLAAIPVRGPVGDCLVTADGVGLADLPREARVGTGSLRRRTQLWHIRPDVRMLDLRGNVETRVRKLLAGEFDALVLAEAGLTRLAVCDAKWQLLPRSVMLPAVGQGALGVEIRADNAVIRQAVYALDDAATRAAVLAERAMLRALSGGCLAPVAGLGELEPPGRLGLTACVMSLDGRTRLAADNVGRVEAPEELGQRVAEMLLAQGAAELIAQSRAAK